MSDPRIVTMRISVGVDAWADDALKAFAIAELQREARELAAVEGIAGPFVEVIDISLREPSADEFIRGHTEPRFVDIVLVRRYQGGAA